jgi:hypothetical protein
LNKQIQGTATLARHDRLANLPVIGSRLTRARLVGIVILIVLGAAVAVSAWRHDLLRTAGWLLVATDPSEPADIIVLATDAGREGVLDAADLVHSGVASRVAIFSEPLSVADRELIKRGVPYFDGTSVIVRQLHTLGVNTVEQIPPAVAGTEDESRQLPPWCLSKGFHTILFVSAPDHSRRVRRVLTRATRGLGLKVIVRPSRYSDFDPDTWWQTRAGVRTELIELEKLALEILCHPLP